MIPTPHRHSRLASSISCFNCRRWRLAHSVANSTPTMSKHPATDLARRIGQRQLRQLNSTPSNTFIKMRLPISQHNRTVKASSYITPQQLVFNRQKIAPDTAGRSLWRSFSSTRMTKRGKRKQCPKNLPDAAPYQHDFCCIAAACVAVGWHFLSVVPTKAAWRRCMTSVSIFRANICQ